MRRRLLILPIVLLANPAAALNATEVDDLVDRLADVIEENYVEPELAAEIVDRLQNGRGRPGMSHGSPAG